MKFIGTLLLLAALGLGAGCKKKQPDQAGETPPEQPPAEAAAAPAPAAAQPKAEAPPKEKLPGAAGVRNDLKRKNWSGAVQGLLALKQLAVANDAWAEYRELSGDVGIALAEAAPADPGAAQALAVYRVAMYGR